MSETWESSQIRLRNIKWPRVNWVLAASLLKREQHVSLPINSTLWCRAKYIDDWQDWHEICYWSLWSPEVDSQWFVMTPWPFVQLYHVVKIPPHQLSLPGFFHSHFWSSHTMYPRSRSWSAFPLQDIVFHFVLVYSTHGNCNKTKHVHLSFFFCSTWWKGPGRRKYYFTCLFLKNQWSVNHNCLKPIYLQYSQIVMMGRLRSWAKLRPTRLQWSYSGILPSAA